MVILAVNSLTAIVSRNRRWTLLLCLSISGYVALWAVMGRFVSVDEVFFKSPGLHWARSGRFAAPELAGFLKVSSAIDMPGLEEVWFVHPPGYPFAFGLFVRAFGFGPRQCIIFDAVIHGVLVFLVYWLARRMAPELSAGVAFAIGVVVLPIAVFARPDELAMCFGLLALIVWGKPTAGFYRSAIAGTDNFVVP